MVVVGPTGRRVLLPARAGRTYPDHGVAVTRLRFDAWLRDAAIAAGAEPVTGRVAAVRARSVELDDGRRLAADVVVGADGATSAVAAAAGLVDPGAVLWGFAQRGLRRRRTSTARSSRCGTRRPGTGSPGTAGCSPARRAPPTWAWGSACEPTGPRRRGRWPASTRSATTSAVSVSCPPPSRAAASAAG